jgi:hypothetical protein
MSNSGYGYAVFMAVLGAFLCLVLWMARRERQSVSSGKGGGIEQYIAIGIVVIPIVVGIGFLISWLFGIAQRANLASQFEGKIDPWKYSVRNLNSNGKLPASPKLIFLEREASDSGYTGAPGEPLSSLTKWEHSENRTPDPPDEVFGDWKPRAAFGNIPDELLARSPSEVNTVVLISKCFWIAGRYTGGSTAYVQSWTVAVVSTQNNAIIAKSENFRGGKPPESSVLSGPHFGDEPDGAWGWVERVVSSGRK